MWSVALLAEFTFRNVFVLHFIVAVETTVTTRFVTEFIKGSMTLIALNHIHTMD